MADDAGRLEKIRGAIKEVLTKKAARMCFNAEEVDLLCVEYTSCALSHRSKQTVESSVTLVQSAFHPRLHHAVALLGSME